LFLSEGRTEVSVGSTGDNSRIAGSDIVSQDINGEVGLLQVL